VLDGTAAPMLDRPLLRLTTGVMMMSMTMEMGGLRGCGLRREGRVVGQGRKRVARDTRKMAGLRKS